MKWVMFLISMLFAGVVAWAGALHDHFIIEQGCGLHEKAKAIGNTLEILLVYFVPLFFYSLWREKFGWSTIPFLISLLLIWWITHDVAMNLYLGVSVGYIGHGAFDQFFGAIFQQSGWLYLAIRGLVLFLGITAYLRLIKD